MRFVGYSTTLATLGRLQSKGYPEQPNRKQSTMRQFETAALHQKSSGLINRVRAALVGGLASVLLFSPLAQAKGPAAGGVNGLAAISAAELPPQGQETYEKIQKGGPFPYEKDGVVFGNRERILPSEKRGYYREYTVKTPGSRDRGARRIVCGGKHNIYSG